jgi:ssDNA-binding Zn-finger/Zn-ribbon topoisomerase 1
MMNAEMQAAIDALHAKPCECVVCSECGGTGDVWWSSDGRHYLGRDRWDDLDEMETCETCGGSGIVETCERCAELNELEEDEDYL